MHVIIMILVHVMSLLVYNLSIVKIHPKFLYENKQTAANMT